MGSIQHRDGQAASSPQGTKSMAKFSMRDTFSRSVTGGGHVADLRAQADKERRCPLRHPRQSAADSGARGTTDVTSSYNVSSSYIDARMHPHGGTHDHVHTSRAALERGRDP